MRVPSRVMPQRWCSTMMEATAVLAAAWTCILPLLAQASAARGFTLRPEHLLAEETPLLLRSGHGSGSTTQAPFPCNTPEGQQGVCRSALSCPSYAPLLDTLQNATVLDFFRTRVCRHGTGFVHVCCPKTPTSQSSLLLFGPPTATEASAGGLFVARSQRPNTRQPSQQDFDNDSEADEDDERRPVNRPRPPPPTTRPSFQAVGFPQSPAAAGQVFRGPDREPPTPASFTSTTRFPQRQDQPPTEPTEPPVLPPEGECGTRAQGRPGSTPWVVGIGKMQTEAFTVFCSGALVSPFHVVAAAHCLQDRSLTHVRLGDPQRLEHNEDVPVATWVTPGYNPSTRENDLALVTLARPVTYTDNIRPACLPFRYRFDGFRGQALQVVGWNSTGNLEAGEVEVLGMDECRAAYTSPAVISNNNVALFSDASDRAAAASSSFSTVLAPNSPSAPSAVSVTRNNLCGSPALAAAATICLSNFGAPLFYNDEETRLTFLTGMASLGDGCQAGPGLYTRIGAFVPWLAQQLSTAETPPQTNAAPANPNRTLQFGR